MKRRAFLAAPLALVVRPVPQVGGQFFELKSASMASPLVFGRPFWPDYFSMDRPVLNPGKILVAALRPIDDPIAIDLYGWLGYPGHA